ncbi:MAG: TauD/TfdA family dioxygenase [Alphaproteobacteria bacterium]|nr:TauD/TfdA family dioxygenase [Alphaproteobacteria bacterium]
MELVATPQHPLFAARISGIDIRCPVSPAQCREIVRLMDRYAVCAIGHDGPPTNEEQIAFSVLLGPMDRGRSPKIEGTGIRIPHNEIVDQSNLDQDGVIYEEGDRRLLFKRANRLWHTDMSFRQVRATYSLLSAHVVPSAGGNTEFVDMRAVYDALPESTRSRLDGLVAEHSYWYSRSLGGGPAPTDAERASRPPARHALVHVCPGSGRKSLYIASHISGIVGWREDEACALIDELMAFATQPRFIYSHDWRVGDVVIWDNLATIHRATPFDDTRYRRDMRRTTCRERLVHS